MERPRKLSMDQNFLQNLIDVVFANLNNDQFGAEELSREIGLSRSQVHRKLQKINGKSITQFIREIRLEEAYKLLQKEVGTASEIAFMTGFGSHAYFTKCFHEYFGYPPGEVKKIKRSQSLDVTDNTNIIPIHRGKECERTEEDEDLKYGDFHKLSVIMFSDISGFTAVMEGSEQKALDLLKKNRNIHQSLIDKYHGKMLKEIGDAIMASFDAPSDAVHCAQQILQLSQEEEGLDLHIGIHLGEVYFTNGEVYGDGVNIASRINTEAKRGELLISDEIYKNIRNKDDINAVEIGEKKLKNVTDPLKIYKVIEQEPATDQGDFEKSTWSRIKSISPWSWATILLVFCLIIVGSLNLYERQLSFTSDIPTIAILPFKNASQDARFDYLELSLADGIIINLMGVQDLRVISDRASFMFYGPNRSYADIAKNLNVDHIVEGSFVPQNDQIQLTIRFVDAASSQIWKSEPLKGSIDKLNVLQGNAAMGIVDAFGIKLSEAETKRVAPGRAVNVSAFEYLQKGRNILRTRNDLESLEKSKNYFYMALLSDPKYPDAYIGLAEVAWREVSSGYEPGIEGMPEVMEHIKKAQEINPERGEIYTLLGLNSLYDNDWHYAQQLFESSIQQNPNYSFTYLCNAWILSANKEHEKAIKSVDIAIRLDPTNLYYQFWKVNFLNFAGYFERAQSIVDMYSTIDSLSSFVMQWQGIIQVEQRMYDNAIKNLVWPRCSIRAYTLGMLGEDIEARKLLIDALKSSKEHYESPSSIAVIYMGLGEYKNAIEYLEQAYEVKDNTAVFLVNSTIYDPIRNDPQFQELLVKMDLAN